MFYFFCSNWALGLMGVAPDVREMAASYARIRGVEWRTHIDFNPLLQYIDLLDCCMPWRASQNLETPGFVNDKKLLRGSIFLLCCASVARLIQCKLAENHQFLCPLLHTAQIIVHCTNVLWRCVNANLWKLLVSTGVYCALGRLKILQALWLGRHWPRVFAFLQF